MAHSLFRAKVHVGYLAAIVAASNAGGSGSVVGDTTTTMMWIAGVSPAGGRQAFAGAAVALAIFGIPAARVQHRYRRSSVTPTNTPYGYAAGRHRGADPCRRGGTNVVINLTFPHANRFPFSAWRCGRRSCSPWRSAGPTGKCCPKPSWARSSCSLVSCASMMPVEKLRPRRGSRPLVWASCRRCSTTFR